MRLDFIYVTVAVDSQGEKTAKYDNILGAVGNTPVIKVDKQAPNGTNLYVKVEAFNPMGSVKDRLALGVIEDAERSGALATGQLNLFGTGTVVNGAPSVGDYYDRGTTQQRAVQVDFVWGILLAQ